MSENLIFAYSRITSGLLSLLTLRVLEFLPCGDLNKVTGESSINVLALLFNMLYTCLRE